MAKIDETKYIKFTEVCKKINKQIGLIFFKNLFPDLKLIKIKNATCFEFEGNRDDYLNKICNTIEQYYFEKNIKNPYDRIDYLFIKYAGMVNKYPFLFKTFKDFAYLKITESKSTESELLLLAGKLFCFFEFLLNYIHLYLNKDINSFTVYDIDKLITENKERTFYLKKFTVYFNYLKNNDLVPDLNLKILRNEHFYLKNDSDFYSLEEWNQFISSAIDIDKHLVNALNNVKYARSWLFVLLHLCIAWRKTDFLSFPPLDNLLGIEKYNLDWFNNNSFTMKDAAYIISNTKLQAEQYLMHKTNTQKHFIVPEAFHIPLAIAIIITENWRRILNSHSLFGKINKCETSKIAMCLGKEFSSFKSLKANRSLLSFLDKTATDIGADHYIKIASYLRSHKTNYYNMSDTTSQYLHASYSDMEINEVLIQLYDRGMFGWLYDSLIHIANNEDEKSSMQEETDLIVQVQNNLSASNIEMIAECIQSQDLKKEKVVNELLKLSKEEISDKILKLANGRLFSKQENIYCIRDLAESNLVSDKCKYSANTGCIYCEFAVPTIHTLYTAVSELNNIFENLNKNLPIYEYDKLRLLDKMLKLFYLLKEASETFGMEYVSAYTDFAELKNNVSLSFKLLMGKGEDNGKK